MCWHNVIQRLLNLAKDVNANSLAWVFLSLCLSVKQLDPEHHTKHKNNALSRFVARSIAA